MDLGSCFVKIYIKYCTLKNKKKMVELRKHTLMSCWVICGCWQKSTFTDIFGSEQALSIKN